MLFEYLDVVVLHVDVDAERGLRGGLARARRARLVARHEPPVVVVGILQKIYGLKAALVYVVK